MLKYAKIVDENTGLCNVGIGDNETFYLSIGMIKQDVQKSEVDGLWYLSEKCPVYSDVDQLQIAKQARIEENDRLRDAKLSEGVTYSNVLFDSDTDQKVNLLAIYNAMTDEDTIVWYGKENQGLLCSRSDLLAIGGLITQLHTYCWEMNAYIKEQIENAASIDELAEIEISYNN